MIFCRPALAGTLARQVSRRGQLTNCCICWEEYEDDVTDENEEAILGVIKQCGHYFHFECIWDWLERKATCPLCRNNVALTADGIQAITYCDISSAAQQRRSVYTTESSGSSENDGLLQRETDSNTIRNSRDIDSNLSANADLIESSDGRSVIHISSEHITSGDTVITEIVRDNQRTDDSVSSSRTGNHPNSKSRRVYKKAANKIPPILRWEDYQRNSDGATRGQAGSSHQHRNVHYRDKRQSRNNSRERASPHTSRAGSTRSSQASIHTGHLGNYTPSSTISRTMSRRVRRKCHICKRRFEGDPRDVVVGYLRECGHYYHCLCLERFVSRYSYCPLCYEHGLATGHASEQIHEEQSLDVFFSLLADILINLDEVPNTDDNTDNGTHFRY